MAKRDKTAVVQTGLRMREPLRAHLQKVADARGVSLNSEIIDRLERSVDRLGLLEEIMMLVYGPDTGKLLAQAHVYGKLLKLKPGQKELIRARVNQVIDALPEKES